MKSIKQTPNSNQQHKQRKPRDSRYLRLKHQHAYTSFSPITSKTVERRLLYSDIYSSRTSKWTKTHQTTSNYQWRNERRIPLQTKISTREPSTTEMKKSAGGHWWSNGCEWTIIFNWRLENLKLQKFKKIIFLSLLQKLSLCLDLDFHSSFSKNRHKRSCLVVWPFQAILSEEFKWWKTGSLRDYSKIVVV